MQTTINSGEATRDVQSPAMKWLAACRVEDVPGDGGACVLLGGEQIAIFYFSRRDQWYATENRCPHKQQMVLSRGMTGSAGPDSEPKVACPFHKKTFSLRTGECLSGEDYRVRTYPVKVKNGKVYIGFPW
ncbi:nitrite reductase small subunit NirD [Puia dinghuensis]|uniref:Nitrite reductase small subunit n=1 Tax=Puia dinghuensis TaxID=1792502 RepID=A0A8J2U960_9BACT|nr:nitrite reductase small subunit NirD [Puia dinghuensis]GGA87820.1 nitrite reductase small subunit [Puia dinghuensis]